jgi:methylthioribulose-1-phosphate dehydratase
MRPALTDELIAAGRWMAAQGLLPATSGNLSARVDRAQVVVTTSGGDKGNLQPEDFLVVDIGIDGPPPSRASAETPLHLALYRRRPDIGAILHGHSIASTLTSQLLADGGRIVLSGYELEKAFAGVRTHEAAVEIPVFENSQDMAALAAEVSAGVAGAPALLLAGHGFYVWGESVADARRHVEALEFLLRCELEKARMRR